MTEAWHMLTEKYVSDTFGTILCETCAHSAHDGTCAAFRDGIPSEILTGSFEHTEPYEGDNGILYEREGSD